MIPDLEISEELAIPTCEHCQEEWVDEATASALDDALQVACDAAISSKADEALRLLRDGRIPQRELEKMIGLSAGYLSKLRNGKTESRGPLVSLLMLLATDTQLIERLKALWSTRCQLAEFVVAPEAPASQTVDVGALRVSEYGVSFMPEQLVVSGISEWRSSRVPHLFAELLVGNNAVEASEPRDVELCAEAA